MNRHTDREGRPEDDDAGPLFARARRVDPDTSKEAAASLGPKVLNRLCGVVLDYLRGRGDAGGTTVEISVATGVERDSLTPRMPDLVKAGLVVDSGERRVSAGRTRACIVWKAVLK